MLCFMNWEETIFVASSKTACASNVQRMGTKKKKKLKKEHFPQINYPFTIRICPGKNKKSSGVFI